MTRRLGLLVIALAFVSMVPLCAAPRASDIPRDHPAIEAIGRLTDAGIVRLGDDGRFHGEEKVSAGEVAWVASRIIAYGSLRLVSRDDKTGLDEYIRTRVEESGSTVEGMDPSAPDYAALAYIGRVNPPGADPPLVAFEGLTRYELAIAADQVLTQLVEAYGSDLSKLVPPEDEKPDWDFGPDGPPPTESHET